MKFPSPSELKLKIPLSSSDEEFIGASRNTCRSILNGSDKRLLLIVGPCSLHDEASTYEYAEKLLELSREVKEEFFIVMRAYLEKPRTKKGWKGIVYDPYLDGSDNIAEGVYLGRKILSNLTKMGIPLGCELLELLTSHYFSDFLTWGCIGARTVASQPHRQLASSMPFPIGFKNTTDGNVLCALNGIVVAQSGHTFLSIDQQGGLSPLTTLGNPDCHLVLRGGENGPNFDQRSIHESEKRSLELNIEKRIVIDCSHDNSRKQEALQIVVFEHLLSQIMNGNTNIAGMMLESHLLEGAQSLHLPLRYGMSITDPCLSFAQTRDLILEGQKKLSSLETYATC